MEKVLLGDDNEQLRRAYKRNFLRDLEVDEAENSIDLVEKARIGNYGLIITDNDYEDNIGGIEAVRMIREFNERTLIVFHTGDLTESVKQDALEAGANYVTSKKDYGELKMILRDHLKR